MNGITRAKVPALPAVLWVLAGLLIAFGSFVPAVVASFFALWLLCKSRQGIIVLSLALGTFAYLSHSHEVKAMRQVKGVLSDFKHTSFQVTVPEAKVMEVQKHLDGYRAKMKLLSSDNIFRGASYNLPKGVFLSAEIIESVLPGEVISFIGHTRRTRSYGNFGEVDWNSFSEKQGYAASIVISEFERLSYPLVKKYEHQAREKIKRWMLQRLRFGLDVDAPLHDFIPALVLGEKPDDQEWVEGFRRAGIIHVFVVSGLHVGMVMAIVWLILYPFPLSSRAILIVSLVTIWFYAWLTGLNAPVVRSTLTITLFASSLRLKLRITPLNTLLIAFLCVILWDHYALYEIGVWLSFGVVLGLISCARLVSRASSSFFTPDAYLPRSLWSVKQRVQLSVGKWLCASVLAGVLAWMISSFITATSFGKVYVLGALTSWLVLPAAFLLMANSGVILILSLVSKDLVIPLNEFNNVLATRVTEMVEKIDEVPWAVWHVRDFEYRDTLTVFNLPKGNASLFLGAGNGVLIDTGSVSSAQGEVRPVLNKAGIVPQVAILSHKDSGHEGGLGVLMPENTLYAYESEPESLQIYNWKVETIPIHVSDSQKSDDKVAFIKLTKNHNTIGYIADAGVEIFEELKRREIPFQCEVLIIGENSGGQTPIADFLAYTGASHVILGRTAFYNPLRTISGVKFYDQRFCGAVRIHATKGKLEIELKQ